MNRKLLNGLVLLALAAGGVGTFTSCKDTEADIRNKVIVGQADLQEQIDAIRGMKDDAFVDALKNWLQENWPKCDCDGTCPGGGNCGDGSCDCGDGDDCNCGGGGGTGCNCGFDKEDYDALKSKVGTLWAVFNAIKNSTFNIDDEKDEAGAVVNSLYNFINSKIKTEWGDQLITDVAALQTAVATNASNISANALAIANAIDDIKANKESIEKINEILASFYNTLAKDIKSIVVNRTFNPIFGTVNLPIGLRSTVVGTYLYSSDTDRNFPMDIASGSNNSEYNKDDDDHLGVYNSPNIAKALAALLTNGHEAMSLKANTPYFTGFDGEEQNNNMGEIYLTVNPVEKNFSGVEVSLVNSQGTKILSNSHLTLESDNETILDFGYTRAQEGNGFYRLPVYLDKVDENNPYWGDFDQIKFDLQNKSGLYNAVKDAFKNHTLSDIAHVGELVYQQLDGILPAYAVKVSWETQEPQFNADGTVVTDDEGNIVYASTNHSVVSDYDIAATALRPLSYHTGAEIGTNRQLPIFDPVTEYFNRYFDDFKKDINIDLGDLGGFSPIEYEKIKVDIDTKNLTGKIDLEGMLVYPVKEYTDMEGNTHYVVDDSEGPIGVLGPDAIINVNWTPGSDMGAWTLDLSSFIEELENTLNTQVGDKIDEIVASVNEMIAQINEQLGGLEASINDQITDIFDRFQNGLQGKLKYADKLVDLYNKLASRVNTFLKDPNHYLQVVMAYNNNETGMHHLSNNINVPTKVKMPADKKMGLELFATSYNADIVAPSFQKYVAIVGAWETGKPETRVDASALPALNNSANSSLNKVVSGRAHRFAVDMSLLKPGMTYEILYTSLDYHGYTSSMLYYISVK